MPVHYENEMLKTPDYLALNPNGAVPAIDGDGLLLFESLAITWHRARNRPRGGLWPGSTGAQLQLLQWRL
ncbi:glutathione S-transferase family protein [Polaromonas sp. UC242_47]|uniref:glutathione S-transferase family protein n=1 Tax=Polaromonas sp. UC242_47 TaxID=3374626 RepID=UPI003790C8F9